MPTGTPQGGVMVVRFSRAHFYARLSEWFCAVLMIGMGVGSAMQPTLFADNPSMAVFAGWAPQVVWTVAWLSVGLIRLAALIINGAWRRSPHLRALTALVSLLVWFLLGFGILQLAIPSLGLSFYAPLFALDLVNVYRAMNDAGASDTAPAQPASAGTP